ncbi:MAG: hypothetical protein ABSA52_00475 [Candidatus Binatia bacterium]
MSCVNLQERFGRQYRVTWEADGVTKRFWAREDWSWLMDIRGRRGVIYPFGGEMLAAVESGARIGAKLRALPCVRSTRGDTETVVTFHVDDAPAVFELLKPYRRRQVSETQRERLRAIGFQRRAHSESDFPALESTQTVGNSPGHLFRRAGFCSATSGLENEGRQ